MLNDSFGTNIVLGRLFDRQHLEKAAARAAILERIREMPNGFDTVVGENGLRLSGGERQRLAIAIYSEPPLSIMDEASSALDDQTEAEIMEQLRLIGKEMTIIAITHRRSSVRADDRTVEPGALERLGETAK